MWSVVFVPTTLYPRFSNLLSTKSGGWVTVIVKLLRLPPRSTIKASSLASSPWSTWQSMNVGCRNATSLPGHWQKLRAMIYGMALSFQMSEMTLLFSVLYTILYTTLMLAALCAQLKRSLVPRIPNFYCGRSHYRGLWLLITVNPFDATKPVDSRGTRNTAPWEHERVDDSVIAFICSPKLYRVRSFARIRIWISDPRSLRSWRTKGTELWFVGSVTMTIGAKSVKAT